MSGLGQAQTGSVRSIPKAANMKASDSKKIVFKNMGNNHAYPMMWAETVAMTGGADVVLASGIEFHGMDLASYANVIATPAGPNAAAGTDVMYITKDTGNNIVTLGCAGTYTGNVDVQYILGGNADAGFIADFDCRANTGAVKNF